MISRGKVDGSYPSGPANPFQRMGEIPPIVDQVAGDQDVIRPGGGGDLQQTALTGAELLVVQIGNL